VQDLVESQTVDECSVYFGLVEKHADALGNVIVNEQRALLSLLRICIELLRRMSKAEHAVLCGRILLLLAKVYPLSDKSGVNLKGEVNVGNVTAFESEEEYNARASMLALAANGHSSSGSSAMQTDTVVTVAPTPATRPIDYAFYSSFWALQVSLATLDRCTA
jgi:hypothetical protein